MTTGLGSSIPGHGVHTLRVPLVGDGPNQLAARVEDTHFDVTRLAHREVDLRDRVERVRGVLFQHDRGAGEILLGDSDVTESDELLADPVRVRANFESDVSVYQS